MEFTMLKSSLSRTRRTDLPVPVSPASPGAHDGRRGGRRLGLTTLAVAAMGVAAALSGAASAAAAAPAKAEPAATVTAEPVYEAFTVLNGGKNLASDSTGIAVASPNAGWLRVWVGCQG
jgi:hypothetical protein